MSSIFITSQLHRDWKSQSLAWAREARLSVTPGRRLAPAPSSVEPPPEEFGGVVRALMPYLNHGINGAQFSAIVSATTANLDVHSSALLPFQYLAGMNLSLDNVHLTWPVDYIGLPLVCTENFPMLSLWSEPDNVPVNIAPIPPDALNRVIIAGYANHAFFPTTFTSPESLSPEDTDFVHARELTRPADHRKFFARTICTNFRYTGCVRVASDDEINLLFRDTIFPETWLKSPVMNLRDFFSSMGVNGDSVERAFIETDRINRSTATPPSDGTATDVPASGATASRSARYSGVLPPIRTARPRANRRFTTSREADAPSAGETAALYVDEAVPSPMAAPTLSPADATFQQNVLRSVYSQQSNNIVFTTPPDSTRIPDEEDEGGN